MHLPPAALAQGMRASGLLIFDADRPIPSQRRRLNAFVRLSTLLPRGTRVEETTIGGVPCRVVRRGDSDPRRVLLHFHGGAWCIGAPSLPTAYAAHVARATGAVVVLPDYRLAPEHPFPAATEDARAVWDALTLDPAVQVALGGDSAGGAIAVSTAAALRDAKRPAPIALALVCPMLDAVVARPHRSDDPVLTPAWLATCAAAYVGAHDPADPRHSPLRGDLGGLPPAVVVSGDRDLLQPDAEAFAAGVTAAGGTVDHLAGSLWHEYPLQAGLLAEADRAVAHVAGFLDHHWTQGRRPGPV